METVDSFCVISSTVYLNVCVIQCVWNFVVCVCVHDVYLLFVMIDNCTMETKNPYMCISQAYSNSASATNNDHGPSHINDKGHALVE